MIHIDLISRDKNDHSVLIKGWAYDTDSNQPLKLSFRSEGCRIEDIVIKEKFREDVNAALEIAGDVDCGFVAKVYLNDFKGKLILEGKNENTQETLILNLKKSRIHPAEVDVRRETFRRGFRQIKQLLRSGNGARYLLRQFKKQLPGTEAVYQRWIDANEVALSPNQVIEELESLKYKPLISLLVPVYNVDLKWLEKMVASVKAQTYPNWQLCMVDDCSENEAIRDYLKEQAESDQRIVVGFNSENKNISVTTNEAFALSSGEFVGLLDNDDELAPNALMEVVKFLNEFPDTDMVYSDEDKIDEQGIRNEPYFKPDFSPDSLLSNNYICHFTVFRRSLFEKEELMREGFEGAQDHDLFLRLAEKTDRIGHIPKILYHWRTLSSSTAQNASNKDYASRAGVRAIEEALKRRGYKGEVKPLKYGGFYEVTYIPDTLKKVSVIIPTKNNANEIRTSVESVIEKTDYPNYEIVIVDNGSDDENTLKTIDSLKERYPDIIQVLRLPIPFNYSRINNRAADFATGDIYVFLNDDTEVITNGWMTIMAGYAQKPWIGCVGAKLLYPDETIQHAGVVMGILGIAGHVFTNLPRNFPGYFRRAELNVNYTAVTAACLMIERDKFWEVGGFDENIAVAFNDVDLCCKVAACGYYNIYLGSVELYHYESKSRGYEDTANRKVRFQKEKGKVVRKWRKYIERDPMYSPNLTLLRGDYSINA